MGKKFCFALLLLFGISFAAADSLFGFLQADGESITVDNYCGKAESDIRVPEWAEVEIAYRYEPEIPAGIIVEQAPPSGSQLKIGSAKRKRLTLTVSLGAESKTVPDVVGQDIRSAISLLRENGFSVREIYREGGTEGQIIEVFPKAGTPLPVGSEITVTVSQGEAAQTVTVPNLVGLSRGYALLEIFRQGLGVEAVTEETSQAPRDSVIRQSPTPGSLVSPNTRLKLVISAGSEQEEFMSE